jgi:prepilin-type N-terminal cleavage/methylation domain-containing protein/prepilin-type processing-associated H-X9-DG protein
MTRPDPRRGAGFTLIELLVVIAIIAVLIALLLPAVQAAREAARRAQCVNNLVQLAVATQNYESSHEMLPPGVVNANGPISNVAKGYHVSWVVQVLPYLEQANAFKKINFRTGVYDGVNSTVRAYVMNSMLCPSDGGATVANGAASNNYAACHNDVEAPIDKTNKGVFYLNSNTRYEDVSDGSSFTIFFGEKLRSAGDLGWMSGTNATLRNAGTPVNGKNAFSVMVLPEDEEDKPVVEEEPSDANLKVGGFGSRHPGGANFAFGDGSVKFLKSSISLRVFRRLGNRADGELVSADQY